MSIQESVKPLAIKNVKQISDYSPFPDLAEGNFHSVCDSKMLKQIVEDGKSALHAEFPVIHASNYMDFTLSGNRSVFEKKYFDRRHMLNKLILAECFEKQGRFLSKIIDGIWLICEESTWVLPAHNTYIRDTPQLILPDTARPVLDLFACETAALLSMAMYLLHAQLAAVSPIICNRVKRELQARIITPYLKEHFWWMGNDEEPMCNWTVWCTQNVLLTAFLSNVLNLPCDDKQQILEKASYSIDCFLKDYGEDGCCDEGAQYYRHAGLCLFGCLDILNAVSDDSFVSIYEDAKIKNIAAYIYHMHVAGPYYFNFADCSPIAGRAGAREYLFGKSTKQELLMCFAAEDYAASYEDGTLLNDESQLLNLYYRTQSIYCLREILQYHSLKKEQTTELSDAPQKDLYYESVGIWIVKDTRFHLAVKTGNNDDSHNHNDTGSIILYKDKRPVLVDIGVETYTQKTFSPDRYDIWTMQSCYHNLPTINGINQSAGENYCASDIEITDDGKLSQLSMNIITAYEISDACYIRSVRFDKCKNEITLIDKTNCKDVILNFITYDHPTVAATSNCGSNDKCTSGTISIGTANIEYTGASSILVETLPITDPRLMTAWDHDLYRIQMQLAGESFKMILR